MKHVTLLFGETKEHVDILEHSKKPSNFLINVPHFVIHVHSYQLATQQDYYTHTKNNQFNISIASISKSSVMSSTGASYALVHVQQKHVEEKLQKEKEAKAKDGADTEGKNVRDSNSGSKNRIHPGSTS